MTLKRQPSPSDSAWRSASPALMGLLAALALAGTACEVTKTEDGEMPTVDVSATEGEMPRYEVVQVEEGRLPSMDVDSEPGRLPKWDVNWADIDVGVREETITVPDVTISSKQKTVRVPTLDLRMPGDEAEIEREDFEIWVKVPHEGYQLRIEEVLAVAGEIWVVAQLRETRASTEMDETELEDRVVIAAPDDVRIHRVVYGDAPMEIGDETIYLKSRSKLDNRVRGGRSLWKRMASAS